MKEQETKEMDEGIGRAWRILFKGIIPLLILCAALCVAKRLKDTAPTVSKKSGDRRVILVTTRKAVVAEYPLILDAMGTVLPARRVELRPQVGGHVAWVHDHLIPGGHFYQGEILLKLDKTDFEQALSQRDSEVQMAQAALEEAGHRLTLARSKLKLEMGNQAVALREMKLLEDEVGEEHLDLVLRRPQLESSMAEVQGAEATVQASRASLASALSRLRDAELDLERTEIRAPFPMVVEQRLVDRGDTMTLGSPLVRLIGSDEFWVKLSLLQRDVKWVTLPGDDGRPGSEVRVYSESAWGPDVFRSGSVLRLLPSVDSDGRMAHLLVSISDPLGISEENHGSPPLLLDSYIRAEIVGSTLPSKVVVPREMVRNGNQVWIMNEEDLLEIRTVPVLYRGRHEIVIDGGVLEGERIVETDLSAPVDGMPLRVKEPSEKSNS